MYDSCINDIIKYSHLCYDRRLVTAAGGNVSMRCEDGVLITAKGVSLRDVAVDKIILCDFNGNILKGDPSLETSKEIAMHTSIYKERSDIDSIIHVHPPFIIGYSINKCNIPMITASAKLKLIEIPVIPYADPGSAELATLVDDAVKKAPGYVKLFALEAHGLIAFDKGMINCFDIAELAEDTANISYISETLKNA